MENFEIKFHHAGMFQSRGEWIHPERREKTYELIYVLKGDFSLIEENTLYRLSKGNVLLLSPDVVHKGFGKSVDVEFFWAHFSLEKGELPFSKRHFSSFSSHQLFRELLHYTNLSKIPDYLVTAILVHILCELQFLSNEENRFFDPLAEKLYEWIRVSANAKLTAHKVSKQFGYSPDHLTRICKRSFGMGVKELINKFIIVQAKHALSNSNAYVKEIAEALGFSSDKAFIGFFKYHEKLSPTEFRTKFARLHINVK